MHIGARGLQMDHRLFGGALFHFCKKSDNLFPVSNDHIAVASLYCSVFMTITNYQLANNPLILEFPLFLSLSVIPQTLNS